VRFALSSQRRCLQGEGGSDESGPEDAGDGGAAARHPDLDAKNTALRLWYSDGLTNPLARGTTYGPAPLNCQSFAAYYPAGVNPCETGNQAHERILATYVAPVLGIPWPSQNIQTLAIFNTFTYGGIGGTQATTSGGSPQGPLISLHDLGHSLGSMADEYPYSSRDVVRPCYTGPEPGSFHHTIMTSAAQMIAAQHKWWRWLGEESLSGGKIGLHEGGGTFPCGQRQPSEHSMMRWIGFDWDQVGREHMVARLTGMGNDEHIVTSRVGGQVVDTGNSRNLDLQPLSLAPGTVVQAEVRDPVGPDGLDWVRNPSTGNSSALLSVADPSSAGTGLLVNGAFALPQPLQARARNAANTGTAYNNVGSSASPLNLLVWDGPISNDPFALSSAGGSTRTTR
jgi:hypothetical protein